MPRLRSVRTKEEAEKVPTDQPLQIELPPEGEIEIEAPGKVASPEEGGDKNPPPKESVVEAREPDDESAALKKRLDELTKAETAARDRETTLTRERDEARRQHAEATKQGEQSREEADEARYVAILNALDAAESEAQSANGAFERAVSEGDYKAQAEANRRLAKAEAAISRHEEAKAAYEEAKKTKTDKKPETQSQQDLFENAIKALPDVAKNWLRSHPEYITDAAKNEDIQYFHQTAVRGGLKAYSPEYFESVETQAGMRKKPDPEIEIEDEDEEVEDPPPVRARSKIVTQAPPTREGHSLSTGRPSSTRVTLTPSQREAAKIAGVDEVTYAKGVLELDKRKKNGMYQERG